AQGALPLEDSRAGVLSALAVKVRAEAEALWAAAPRAVGMTDEGTVRLTAQAFGPLSRQLEAVLEGLGALGGFASGHEEADLLALARRASELGAELDFVRRADAPDHVYWAEGRGRGLFLRAAPISVAEAMRERLYGSVDTVVFTSATLRTGTSFEYFCRQVGLLDDEGEAVVPLTQLAVPSSFDYASQSALYLPTDLPEPREPGFPEAVAEEIARLVEVTGGRAFALFTSLRNMERVHGLLSKRLPYPMLLQGEAPKPVLLDAFQSTPSVLFASASFWEGVDVPGDALSLVILDKLPFAAPTHPVVAARIEALEKAGREPFSSYQLPEAALALRQGFGRLIRTRTDRGIVALLDVRVGRKAYGRQLLAGLPPARRFREIGPLADWFRRGEKQSG
ncbi:MAG TPA: ATP-dependent DNA helicase, partial [Myxococcaceae bacterium]|nr:ATP-dependent DNA helicase [Myxococcaceae bacterium]